MKKKKLSIIIPVYFNEDNLKPLYQDVKKKIIEKIDFNYEIIFVDDGSKDNSWNVICDLIKKNRNIKAIKLSRNFGSHSAIMCGLAKCTGDCAVVKAADLQEPTELILKMYQEWQNGNNVVLATRKEREDKSLFSNLYYFITRKFALSNMPKNGFDVYLIDRKVINVLCSLDETNSALTGQILWSGFKTTTVDYVRKKREIGKSKWTLKKKIKLVTDTLFSFSTIPISIISLIGVISCLIALVWSIVILYNKLNNNISVEGYTTIVLMQLFCFGFTMLTLSVLGGYLWRTFDSSRNRPNYIIEEIK